MKLTYKIAVFTLVILEVCVLASSIFASECREGFWGLTTSGETVDGEDYSGVATSTRYCLSDGAANLDEYRALSPDGNVVFMDASFDFPSDDGQRVQTLWVMGGDPGFPPAT